MTAVPSLGLDTIDRRILVELTHSGRTSMAELAQRVHVSRANAYARVRRLVDQGVIERFTTHVSPEGVGFGTSAYVSIVIRQNAWPGVGDALNRVPGVEHISLCSGDVDVMVLVRAADNNSLRDLVLNRIRAIPGVLKTRTTIVLDEIRGPGLVAALDETAQEPCDRIAL